MAIPVLIAWRDKTLFAEGCSARTLLRALSAHNPTEHSACHALPLSLDVPSLMIGLSSALAIPLYYAIRRHLLTLDDRMREIGLVGKKEARRIVDFDVTLPINGRTYWAAILCGVVLAGVGLYFYSHVANQQAWSRLFHHWVGSEDPMIPAQNWWASSQYKIAAASWLAVGCIGSWYALLQARLNYLLFRRLRRPDLPQTDYLRKDCDGQHGWAAFDRVFALSLAGSANFLLAIFPILYLLVGTDATRLSSLIAFAATVFGGIMCTMLIVQFRAFVLQSYGKAWSHEEKRLARVIRRGGRRAPVAQMQLTEMGPPDTFPLTGRWKLTLQVCGTLIAAAFVGIAAACGNWVMEAML